MTENTTAFVFTFPPSTYELLKERMGENAPKTITMREANSIADEKRAVELASDGGAPLFRKIQVMLTVVQLDGKPVTYPEVTAFFDKIPAKVSDMITSAWLEINVASKEEMVNFTTSKSLTFV